MILRPFRVDRPTEQLRTNYHRSRTIVMKFAKVLFTVSFFISILLGPMPPAMSRDEVPGRRSVTSKDPSTVTPISRDEVGPLIILYGTKENANTSVPPPPLQRLSQDGNYFLTEQPQFIVTYTGFTDEAGAAFQYAVDIWGSLIRVARVNPN